MIRADDRTYQFRSDRYCRIRTLSPLHLEKSVEFYEIVLRPGGALRKLRRIFKGRRELLTVQRGSVRVTAGGDMTELKTGDSAHYPADVQHAIENIGPEASRAVPGRNLFAELKLSTARIEH